MSEGNNKASECKEIKWNESKRKKALKWIEQELEEEEEEEESSSRRWSRRGEEERKTLINKNMLINVKVRRNTEAQLPEEKDGAKLLVRKATLERVVYGRG